MFFFILYPLLYFSFRIEPPCFDNFELTVTSQDEEIYLHYVFRDVQYSPKVEQIRWTKNSSMLDLSNNKYGGGKLTENGLTITSPDEKDKGEYTCILSNDMGFFSKSVKLGL